MDCLLYAVSRYSLAVFMRCDCGQTDLAELYLRCVTANVIRRKFFLLSCNVREIKVIICDFIQLNASSTIFVKKYTILREEPAFFLDKNNNLS